MEAVLVVWIANSLLKVFPDTLPPLEPTTEIVLSAARNEWESAQIVVRSHQPVEQLSVRVSNLKQANGTGIIEAKHVECSLIGFIPIEHNTPGTPQEALLCQAPCEVPDVLFGTDHGPLRSERTQPIWLSVYVPSGTPAGTYQATAELAADDAKLFIPIELTVFDFEIPQQRHLHVTNWFSEHKIAQAHNVDLWSEEFFDILAAYARNMAEHREDIFWVSPWLIRVFREADGHLSFDDSLFDRFVETFRSVGVDGGIEIRPVAHHGEGGWVSTEIHLHQLTVTDRVTGESTQLPPDEGLGPFLAHLQQHLEERGWLDGAMIHITDEPAAHNLRAWRRASQFVHRYAPQLKRIEAIETTDFGDDLDVWVPKLSHLRNWYEHFDAVREQWRNQPQKQMWYYICVHPFGGQFMNRFLDYPLMHTRLLHWLNHRYALPGYLHWGWNHWDDAPFDAPSKRLPPGDTHVVYPGDDGPLNSIRWEVQRDSLEDYEYLWILSTREEQVAEQLGHTAQTLARERRSSEYCRRLVRDFTNYETDPDRLASLREELAREIESLKQEPLILWETLPSQDMSLVPAPIMVEVRGVTYPSARIEINGKSIEVGSDGLFHIQVPLSAGNLQIRLSVEHEANRKEQVRCFRLQEYSLGKP